MDEICILIAEKKKKGVFKRYLYLRRTVEKLDIALNIYTIYCPHSVFTDRRLKKICSKYKYVYTNDIIFSKYTKRKKGSLISFMPHIALTKISNIHKISLSAEPVGLVIKSRKFVTGELLSKLCKNIKYISLYEGDRQIESLLMEATGICAKRGSGYKERLIIYLDDDIYFEAENRKINDLILEIPPKLKEDLICSELIYDLLKIKKPEKRLKTLEVNIKGALYT